MEYGTPTPHPGVTLQDVPLQRAVVAVEEIGHATGTGFETAKSRLRYAYARLRAELGDLQ